jgi:predicted P-loop ATPase
MAEGWRSRLMVTGDGKPRALLANAITALQYAPEWEGVLGFNEFSLGVVMLKSAPWGGKAATAWTDQEDRLTADWLQHQGILVGVEIAGQAVQTVARQREFHPVREYLDSLKWDGTSRIDGWLSLYLGVEQGEYAAAVGARWLISAVARIYKPGAKCDCCLILEGPQGAGKSRALKILGGDRFADEIAELGSKDAAMQTRGVWIIEIAELDSMSRAEVGRIKAFMSRPVDRFRPPYGRAVIEAPRQCVFAGSVNHSTYLRDETGGRRFWPVQCGRIDLEPLSRDRDQLWAEARERFNAGAVWWLESRELNEAATEEQAARYDGDPWDGAIANWIEARDSVTVEQVLTLCIQKPQKDCTQADQNRVARSLRALKWERFRQREEGVLRWKYRRPQ